MCETYFFVEFEFETKEIKNKQAVDSFLINFDCQKSKALQFQMLLLFSMK